MSARAQAVAAESRSIEESQGRAIAARAENENRPRTALEAMAMRLEVTPQVLQSTLRSTVFSACRSNEEFVALVVVANEYRLNPLLKEIYAFPTKGGGIQAMVSIDGWIRIMNEHPQFDAIEFEYINNDKGLTDAIEAVIYRKDKSRPTKVIEYMDECKRNTEPWNKSPRRMLRHRALIQGARIAFGFSGIVSEDEEIELTSQPTTAPSLPSNQSLAEELGDEIPAFDGETGEVIEDEPAQDAATGMTTVSEEDARALDAGDAEQAVKAEASEEQAAEDTAAEPEPDARQTKIAEIKGGIRNAKTKSYLKATEDEYVKHMAALPKEACDEIEAALAAKKRELGEGGGE